MSSAGVSAIGAGAVSDAHKSATGGAAAGISMAGSNSIISAGLALFLAAGTAR